MIPTFVRAYEAATAVEGHRILKFSDAANTSVVAHADADDAPLIGVSDEMGAKTGGMCDVHRGGLISVHLGGTVTAGAPLTSDANGKAIAAVATTGTTVRIIGYSDEPGVEDDIIDVFFAPGILHEA